jgi:drug/metabolite transporter (DMT)-like permease
VSNPASALGRTTLPPALGILAGVIAVSTASIFVRFAQQAGASSLTIAALRLSLASAALLPFALARCRPEYRLLSGRELMIAMVSGVCLGGHFATWIGSLAYTSVVSSVVLVSFAPLFIAIASAIFLHEPLTRPIIVGMLIAILGGIVIGVAGSAGATPGSNPLLGNALALAGALCLTPYLLIGRILRSRLSLLAYITLVYGAAAIVLLALVVLTDTPLLASDPAALVWIALLALVPQLIGHTSFNWSVRRLPAVYATIPVLGEPIGSSILAVLWLGEVLSPLVLAGAVLAIGGIALMSIRQDP